MQSLILIGQIVLLFLLIYLVLLLSYSLFRGAPYAALSKKKIKIMMELLDTKKGRFIDIGSGDGRIVIAAAKMGMLSYGIEINPLLALISMIKIRTAKQKNAHIILGDCWKHSFSDYDFISVWGTAHMMRALEKKLLSELRPGAKVVSNHFKFPNWKAKKSKNDAYLYVR